MERILDVMKGFTDCLLGAEVEGMVYGSGVYQSGMCRIPKVLLYALKLLRR